MSVAAATSAVSAAPRASLPVAATSGEDFGAILETATVEDTPDAGVAKHTTSAKDGAGKNPVTPQTDKTETDARTANDGLLAGATALALQPQPVTQPPAQEDAPSAAAPSAEAPAPPQPVPALPKSSSLPAAAVQAATAAVTAVAALDAQDAGTAPVDAEGAPAEDATDAVPGRPASAGANASAAIDALPKAPSGVSGAAKEATPAPTPDAAPLQPASVTASKAITEAPANALGATGESKDDASATRPDAGDSAKAGAAAGKATEAAAPVKTTAPAPALIPQTADAAPLPADVAAAGQPAAPTTSSTPAVALTHAALSGLSHATAETMVHLAAQITRRLEGRSTQFEMTLTPEGLGRVDVSLDIDADGQLAARLAFDNPLAATDLKGRADELRRQLEDAGFTLSQDALEFSQRDGSGSGNGFDRRHDRAFGGRAFANASRNALDADAAVQAPTAWMSLTLTPRGVDMKV